MPVFHTKTIESILEPVAQQVRLSPSRSKACETNVSRICLQVSRLIILNEEANQHENVLPDLSKSVQVVQNAVGNLVEVGEETCANSIDDRLRVEMPQALERVNQASNLLLDAARLLKYESDSIRGRKMLIEGARCKSTND